MNSHEFGKHDLQPTSESVDLDAEWTEDYHLDHAVEISELLLSMEDEAERRPEMEKDATSKANEIHEEIIFRKGKKYRKMISDIKSILGGDGVIIEKADKFDLSDRKFPIDWFLLCHSKFDYDSEVSICQVISDGIFDILGLAEDKRPTLKLNKAIDERGSEDIKADKYITYLGYFKDPEDRRHTAPFVQENGTIEINLFNFGSETSILHVLETLEHECFHAYQFNCRRGKVPMQTVRDRVVRAAYSYGNAQYIDPENDYEGYYRQGYESSARVFANQLTHATAELFRGAILQATKKGDVNE